MARFPIPYPCVGLFILNGLEKLVPKTHIGLYRDDGLAAINLPGPRIERLRKDITKFFKTQPTNHNQYKHQNCKFSRCHP